MNPAMHENKTLSYVKKKEIIIRKQKTQPHINTTQKQMIIIIQCTAMYILS